MEFGDIIQGAWRITWRRKWLWLPGLLVVIGVGGNTAGGGAPTGVNLSGAAPVAALTADRLVVILSIASVLLVLGVLLWVASVVARGALIAGVDRLAQTGVCTLGQAWTAGVTHFGRLFLIGLLTALPGLLLAFLTFVAAIPAMTGAEAGGVLSATVIACFLPLCCVLVVAGLLLGLVQQFADRAAVMEDLPPLAALERGWAVLRAHFSDAVILLVVWAVVAWFFQSLITVGVAVTLPVIFQTAGGAAVEFGAVVLMVIGVLASAVVVALFAIFNVFTSAVWTLAYQRFIA